MNENETQDQNVNLFVYGSLRDPSIFQSVCGMSFTRKPSEKEATVLHGELASALYGHDAMPKILASFIGGLGGRDISTEEFFEMASVIKRSFEEGSTPPPRLLYTDEELREIRKFQTIANLERNELGGEK